jgi:hypothetical protein
MTPTNRWLAAYLVIGAGLFFAAGTWAQEPTGADDAWLYPIVRHAKIGAIDTKGREIVPAEFDALGDITVENWPQFPRVGDIVWQWSRWSPIDISVPDSLIAFSRGGASGFLNADGSIAIAARFERVGPIGRDVHLAPARIDGRWGYIDRRGEFTIPPIFDNARPFHWQRIAAVQQGEKWGLIDAKGEWIVTPRFDQSPYPGSDALFPVVIEGKWGYLSAEGDMVIEPKFDAITEAMMFREGLVNVHVGDKMGYIDESGNVVIEPQYDSASPFDKGIATVQNGDDCAYIKKTGEFLVPYGRYDICHHFFGPLARVGRHEQIKGRSEIKWGAIDLLGQEVIAIGRFDSIDVFHEGLAAVEKDGAGGYIDGDGKLVIPLGHNGIRGGRAFSSGLAPAVGGKGPRWRWGYIDRNGAWVIEARFDDADPFRQELAFVELKKSVGFVDREGKLVFEVDLEEVAR